MNKQAALMIPDGKVKEKLVTTLIDLAHNPAEQEILRKNIGRLAITDADEKIAKEILENAQWLI